MAKPSFINLSNSYPKEKAPCDGNWSNQGAIRMGLALNGELTINVSQATYSEPRCSHGHPRGAESLANWLWKHHLGAPKIYKNGAQAKLLLKAKTNIIFFGFSRARSHLDQR